MCTYLSKSVYQSGQLIMAGVRCHFVCSEAVLSDRIDITPGHTQLTNKLNVTILGRQVEGRGSILW